MKKDDAFQETLLVEDRSLTDEEWRWGHAFAELGGTARDGETTATRYG